MIYKMNSTQYNAIKFCNPKRTPLTHEEIIDYVNGSLSHTIINQRGVTVEHNNKTMAHVRFSPIRAISNILIVERE
jgi:hypothetical protein